MADTDVKQLLLQVDASVELLRRNLTAGSAQVDRFTTDTQRRLDATDRRFAAFGQPLNGIAATVARTNAQIATIGNSVEGVERRMRASGDGIKRALLASTAGVAAAFSLDKVKEFADGYTRFTNQLKVAGLEGTKLTGVQESLYQVAQKYGAPLEAIGTLYGRAAQSGKSLGASQGDLLKLTGAVGAALKIQGGSAAEAEGALLQLSQALGSGVVHAEEFNSVNEGLRPILQAAADASNKYRGNIAALKNDVIAQKLTSQEFFKLILAGYDSLQTKAAKAGLTIGASFTVLNNALGRYIGQTDEALSLTARLSGGIVGLANNLDIIVPALAGIAVGFAAVKAGGAAFQGVTTLVATAAQADRELAAAVLAGNASFIDRAALVARSAIVAQEAAAAEVAAIEQTIAARRADAVALQANIALIAEQRAAAIQSQVAITAAQGLGFGTLGQGGATRTGSQIDAGRALKAEIATKQALQAVNAELAASEAALATAQTRAAVATTAAAEATAAATIGSKVAAGATAVLAGALNLLTAALPIVAIGALVAGVIYFHQTAGQAAEEIRKFDADVDAFRDTLSETAEYGKAAASATSQVGTAAAGSTPGVRAFAGAVGDAADQLFRLAEGRRKAAIEALRADETKFGSAADSFTTRYQNEKAKTIAGVASGNDVAPIQSSEGEAARQRAIIARSQQNIARIERERLEGLPMVSFTKPSEREGGRDIDGDLARVTRDLVIARKAGIKSQVDSLEAQKYELTQYKAYRKQGLSPQAATAAAQKDSGDFKNAAQGAADRKAGAKSSREAAAGKRKEAAAVVDAANDARAYATASRQAQDTIAGANAELANSAALRAQIERGRIEADRKIKNEEIDQQLKAGRYGGADGAQAKARADALKNLNNIAAVAQTQVVDQREQQRLAQDAADVAAHGLEIQRDLLGEESNLTTTAAARRLAELRLLDLQEQEESLRLKRILAFDSGASASERGQALVDLNTQDARFGAKRAGVIANTRGPAEQYLHDLNARDLNEQLQQVKVNGLDNIENGLVGIVSGTRSVKDAFKDMAASIIADLARIAIRKFIVKNIAGSLLGFADGGPVKGYAEGGPIYGAGTERSDSIPAMLSNGEYVINAAATKMHRPLLDAINSGRARRFADGGPVTPSASFAQRAPSLKGLGRQGGGGRVQVDVRTKVEPSPMFAVQMQAVSTQTVSAAAPIIADMGAARALGIANRANLPVNG